MSSNRPIKFVASGFPSPADDFAQHSLDLNSFVIKHPAATFLMRNRSTLNQCYGILPDDIVVVDRSLKPVSKFLNLVVIDDEFKILSYRDLQKQKSQIELWGVITAVIRKF